MLNFEKMRTLMSLCIISYEYQNLQVLFGISTDDLGCSEKEIQLFFSAQLDF